MTAREVVKEFRRSLMLLLAAAEIEEHRRPSRKTVLRLGSSAVATALTSRRRLLPGYQIIVNRGWYEFARDAANTFYSRSVVLSPRDMTVLIGPALNRQQFSALLRELVTTYVTTNRWHSESPDGANAFFDPSARRRIRPSSTGHRYPTLLAEYIGHFTLGHELGHITLGHCDRHWTSPEQNWKDEFDADVAGFEMVLDLLTLDSSRFSGLDYSLGIERVTARDLSLVAALDAVAIAFALMDLWRIAAEQLRLAGWDSHPPGRHRYLALRHHCIESGIIAERLDFAIATVDPERLFSENLIGLEPPDDVQYLYQHAALDIEWSASGTTAPPHGTGVVVDALLDTYLRGARELDAITPQDLAAARHALEDAVDAAPQNASFKQALAGVNVRLAAQALRAERLDDALTYLRAVERALDALSALELNADPPKAIVTAARKQVVDTILERTDHLPDVQTLVALLPQLEQLPPRPPNPEPAMPRTAAEAARAMLDEQMAGMMALSRYWDDFEQTLYSSIEEQSDEDE
jgi:hypothetical protein